MGLKVQDSEMAGAIETAYSILEESVGGKKEGHRRVCHSHYPGITPISLRFQLNLWLVCLPASSYCSKITIATISRIIKYSIYKEHEHSYSPVIHPKQESFQAQLHY